MCRMASFLYKNSEANGVEIAVYDLTSHSGTQRKLNLTERMGWYEGHYLPDGKIECRTPDGVDKEAQAEIKRRYPTFISFINWCFTQTINGWLDLSGCNLKDIKLPETVNGTLFLDGCNLKGTTLPKTINGNIDLEGSKNLKGVKLPETIEGYIDLSECDLKGVKLPKKFSYLYLRRCKLKDIKLPETINGSLNLSRCNLKGVKLPQTINGNLYLYKCDLQGVTLPETIKGFLDIYKATNIDEEAIKKIEISGEIYR